MTAMQKAKSTLGAALSITVEALITAQYFAKRESLGGSPL